jgi:hypothetical protein
MKEQASMYIQPIHTTDTHAINDLMMAMMGMDTMAYVKPITEGAVQGYGVFAADGTPLAVFESLEMAFFTARSHNLEPVSVQ